MWNLDPTTCSSMEIFEIDSSIRQRILDSFSTNEDEVATNVKKISEWAKNQVALPSKSQDPKFVELILIKNKFDVERTKTKMESYFKTIKLYPEIFSKLGGFKLSEERITVMCMPTLTPACERVGFLKINPESKIDCNVKRCLRVLVSIGTVIFHNDRTGNNRFIFDFAGFSLLHLAKIKPTTAWKLKNVYEKVLSVRIAGIELLNVPSYVSGLYRLLSLVLSPKILSRITIHNTLDSLYENIPKECLPYDYGGYLGTIEEMSENWNDIVGSQQELYAAISSLATGESAEGGRDF